MANLIRKPPTKEQRLVLDALHEKGMDEQVRILANQQGIYSEHYASVQTEDELKKFLTVDTDLLEVKRKCRILSYTDDTVLITGESGTGKEILAKSLHGERGGKFIPLNCAAISPELIESELFGHTVGSFTGATAAREGIFQAAAGGTVFLDEMGELPLKAQAALLRTLQFGTVRRVGSNIEEKISCRIVCATWHKLEEQIDKGLFREDLYYRVSRVVLRTKPLRRRPEDTKLILKKLDSQKLLTEEDINKVIYLFDSSFDTKEIAGTKELKGNVRELENIVRRIELFGKESL